jgi:hypothetical protein
MDEERRQKLKEAISARLAQQQQKGRIEEPSNEAFQSEIQKYTAF